MIPAARRLRDDAGPQSPINLIRDVSKAVRDLVSLQCEMVELGSRTLKGFAQKAEVHEVVWR